MSIILELTQDDFNTKYAPLALLMLVYRHTGWLTPLQEVGLTMKKRRFTPLDKLLQVLFSMLAGCEYISEVNVKLRPELALAQVWDWPRFAEQSTLSETLDQLTLTHLPAFRRAVRHIWRQHSWTLRHDWRGFLLLDVDLCGLPCGQQGEQGQKGYFSGKKTRRDGS